VLAAYMVQLHCCVLTERQETIMRNAHLNYIHVFYSCICFKEIIYIL